MLLLLLYKGNKRSLALSHYFMLEVLNSGHLFWLYASRYGQIFKADGMKYIKEKCMPHAERALPKRCNKTLQSLCLPTWLHGIVEIGRLACLSFLS
jgi:hypothetical protein